MRRDKILLAATPLLTALISFITVPILTWVFAPEAIAKYAILQVLIIFTTVLFTLGTDHSYIRNFHSCNNVDELFLKTLLITFFVSVLSFFFLLLFPYHIKKLFQYDDISLIITILSTFVVASLSRVFVVYYRMTENGKGYLFLLILPKVTLLLLVAFSMATETVVDLSFKTISFFVLASYLPCIPSFYNVYFCAKLRVKVKESGSVKCKDLIGYGFPLCISALVSWFMLSSDRLFIRYHLDLESLAIYALALNFASVGSVLSSMFTTLWVPLVMKWHSDKSKIFLVPKIYRLVQVISIFVWFLTIVFGDFIHLIIPSYYYGVTYYFPILILIHVFYCMSEFSSVGLNIARKPSKILFSSLLMLFVNFLLMFILIPYMGMPGAAISMGVVMYLFMIIRTELCIKYWLKIERCRPYFIGLVMLSLSSVYSYYQSAVEVDVKVTAIVIFLTVCILYKNDFHFALIKVRNEFSRSI